MNEKQKLSTELLFAICSNTVTRGYQMKLGGLKDTNKEEVQTKSNFFIYAITL